MLRPHDIAVALQLALTPEAPYGILSKAVGISQGEAHNSVQRLTTARLLRAHHKAPNRNALMEFITAGVKYAFYAEPGSQTRGVPTAHSAPAFAGIVGQSDPVVWPTAAGKVRGAALEPLYPGAPLTARNNPDLYELLTLVDCLRIGRARERERATTMLADRLMKAEPEPQPA